MQRPKRPAVLPERPKRGSSYVSPYRVAGGGSQASRSPAGSRNLSNNSAKNRFAYKSPGGAAGQTPPARRVGISPGVASNNSNRNRSNDRNQDRMVVGNRFYSPGNGIQTTGNRRAPAGGNKFSPANSNNSATFNRTGGSQKGGSQSGASNRLYSPSGRMRLSGSNNMGNDSP